MGIFSKKAAAAAPSGPVERGDATQVTLICYTAVPAANQKLQFPLTTTVEDALKAVCAKFNVPFCEHYGLYVPSPFNSYLDNAALLADTQLSENSKVQVKLRMNAPVHYSFHVETPSNVLSRMKKVKLFTDLDGQGRTYLHLAAALDYKVLVYSLRKKGISVNDCDNFGRTALHYACKSGDLKRIDVLLQNNAAVSCGCKGNRAPLHYLAEANVIDETKYRKAIDLLSKAGETCFAKDLEGNTPLHLAAAAGNTVFLKYWHEKKMFIPNMTNTQGETPLHFGASSNSLVMIRWLLSNGADRYVLSSCGKLPLDIAQEAGNSQIAEALSDVGDTEMENMWTLIKEAKFDEFKTIVDTINVGKRSHALDKKLNTYLVWSAARLCLPFVDYLLNIDGMCPRFTVNGSSTLSCLVSCSRKAIVHDELYGPVLAKCIEKGGSANEKNGRGDSLLHVGSLAANRVAVHILLDLGAFTNSVNFSGYSELHYAILTEHEGLVSDLLRGNSDPNLATMSGETALMFARRVKKNAIADFLEEASKSASADPTSTTAFQPNAVKLRLISGKDLIAKDETGFSDPYCVLRHRLGDLQAVHRSGVQQATLEPEWNETFNFVIKQDNVYYRDVLVDIYDWDQPDETADAVAQVDDFMGRATVLLDPRTKQQTLTVEVADQNGKAGYIEIELTYAEMGVADLTATVQDSYKPFDVLEEVNAMLSNTGSKSVGLAKRALGYKPKYPVMIVPGLASSALICWETDKEAWKMERVWVDPFKIGKAAAFQKLSNKMKGKSKKKEDDLDEDLNKDQRRWLKHILLAADGVSDPPGIKVRPVDGLSGCDYLSDSPLAKKATYVFGHVIQTLADAGYDAMSLDAAPYDWRIPPEHLEVRDHYFTRLKTRVEMMRKINGEKVVLMAHSMGNRCVQYFLEWLKENDEEWIDENIHAFLALGPPFLGACKSVRAVVSGDQMGLEVFLTAEEGRTMARGSGSLPWLFPMQEAQFPDVIARINTSYQSSKLTKESSKPALLHSGSRSSITDVVKETWEEKNVSTLVEQCAPSSFGFYNQFYAANPKYLAGFKEGDCCDLPPILSPPPVKNLWVIAGVNLPTEMSYYFRPHVTSKGDTRFVLDSRADKYSEKKIAGVNPRGLQIAGGMGFETRNTYQPKFRRNRSGDGTVTYCSLMYVEEWREQAKASGQQIDIQVVEVEGAEHRAMLAHDAVFSAIIDFVCEKPMG